jgi:hypothetical protein
MAIGWAGDRKDIRMSGREEVDMRNE